MSEQKTRDDNTEIRANVMVVDLEELPRRWGWLLALGILMLVAGCIGLYMTVAVTLVTVLFYGGLIMAGGILTLLQSLRVREEKWHGRLGHVLLALLYLLTGTLILVNPVAASAALTLLLAALFMAMGVLRMTYGFRCRKKGWKWISPVVVGLIDIIFALVIAFSWPVSGLWVIGLFVSIEMLMNGWILTFTAIAARRLARQSGSA
ncbi:MAG TPA: HdeD family acid-resistance protein [Desulfobulbus sp.]|nr:HdeD family acid-resistance protein [Desulfobulbus sp.]